MKRMSAILFVSGFLFFSPAIFAKQLGQVQFPIACSAQSQTDFNDALALVHHMMYIQAEAKFNAIIAKDPNCAMAYWGLALTQTQPLWGSQPSEAALMKGEAALKKAESLVAPSNKVAIAFINALKPLYVNWQKVPFKQRLHAWERAQYLLYKKYPRNPEAVALFALSHLAIAPKGDKSYRNQKSAGKLLENMHSQNPMHPAAYHYTIHAYDNPVLAKKAEKYARGYAKVAPDVPHALHMPSHIFVRLGQWPETIEWNIRSAAAAKRQALKDGVMPMHYVHAMDYLMYAYLQEGQDKKAAQVFNKVNAVKKFQDSFSTAYGIAAVRARFYLERQQWNKAATLPVDQPSGYPWSKYPAAEAITYFARGIGAARSGNLEEAESSVKKLIEFEVALKKQGQTYWAVLTDAKQTAVQAWVDFSNGQKKRAVQLMERAAELELSVDKHPVTPSEVLPATELLGDMFLKLNLPIKALAEYQTTLRFSPNRLNALYGAGFSAEKMGNVKLARKYYQKLLLLTKNADTEFAEISHAKKFMKH